MDEIRSCDGSGSKVKSLTFELPFKLNKECFQIMFNKPISERHSHGRILAHPCPTPSKYLYKFKGWQCVVCLLVCLLTWSCVSGSIYCCTFVYGVQYNSRLHQLSLVLRPKHHSSDHVTSHEILIPKCGEEIFSNRQLGMRVYIRIVMIMVLE
jgi:hypothetical protein